MGIQPHDYGKIYSWSRNHVLPRRSRAYVLDLHANELLNKFYNVLAFLGR